MTAMNPTFFKTSSKVICKQWLPAGFSLYQAFPVRVTSIISPSSFWVQLQSPSYKDTLELLEYKMDEFYINDKKKNEEVSDAECKFKNRQYAAVFFNERIRRVRVHNIQPFDDDFVATLFHIDYGWITKDYCSSLMKLHQDFTFLPQQAIWATLAEIIPANQELPWKIDDACTFAKLIEGKDLEALLVGVFPKRLKMHLVLNDISNALEHVNINEKLIELDVAIAGQTIDLHSLNC